MQSTQIEPIGLTSATCPPALRVYPIPDRTEIALIWKPTTTGSSLYPFRRNEDFTYSYPALSLKCFAHGGQGRFRSKRPPARSPAQVDIPDCEFNFLIPNLKGADAYEYIEARCTYRRWLGNGADRPLLLSPTQPALNAHNNTILCCPFTSMVAMVEQYFTSLFNDDLTTLRDHNAGRDFLANLGKSDYKPFDTPHILLRTHGMNTSHFLVADITFEEQAWLHLSCTGYSRQSIGGSVVVPLMPYCHEGIDGLITPPSAHGLSWFVHLEPQGRSRNETGTSGAQLIAQITPSISNILRS